MRDTSFLDRVSPFLVKIIISLIAVSILNSIIGLIIPFFHFNIMQLFCYALSFGGTYIGYRKYHQQDISFPFGLTPVQFYAIFSILCSSLYGLGAVTAIPGKLAIASGIFWSIGTLLTMIMLVISIHNVSKLPEGHREQWSDNLFAYMLLTISIIELSVFCFFTIQSFIPGIPIINSLLHITTSSQAALILNYIAIIGFGCRMMHTYGDQISNSYHPIGGEGQGLRSSAVEPWGGRTFYFGKNAPIKQKEPHDWGNGQTLGSE